MASSFFAAKPITPPDGLPEGEGAFLACSFWLIDNYILQRRYTLTWALHLASRRCRKTDGSGEKLGSDGHTI